MGVFINSPPASPWLWAPLLHDRFRSVPSTYAFSSAEALNVAASVCMPLNSTVRIFGLGQSAEEAAREAKMAVFLLAANSTANLSRCGDPLATRSYAALSWPASPKQCFLSTAAADWKGRSQLDLARQ